MRTGKKAAKCAAQTFGLNCGSDSEKEQEANVFNQGYWFLI
jgi:hypothetical protein